MKFRVKRVKRADYHNHERLDERFVNATMSVPPEVGACMRIAFDRLGYGIWQTSPVVSVVKTGPLTVICTRNSVYNIKSGWEK